MPETKQEKDQKKITVWVDDDLHDQFRIKVIQSKASSMQSVLEDLIRKYCDGVSVYPREVAETEHDTYVGFVNWFREYREFKWMETLVEEWTARGRKIRGN